MTVLDDKAWIDMGSYIGTGVYGSENPNNLTFNFSPKFIYILTFASIDGHYKYVMELHRLSNFANRVESSGNIPGCVVTWTEKGVAWYNRKSNDYQCNVSGIDYFYIAIG